MREKKFPPSDRKSVGLDSNKRNPVAELGVTCHRSQRKQEKRRDFEKKNWVEAFEVGGLVILA